MIPRAFSNSDKLWCQHQIAKRQGLSYSCRVCPIYTQQVIVPNSPLRANDSPPAWRLTDSSANCTRHLVPRGSPVPGTPRGPGSHAAVFPHTSPTQSPHVPRCVSSRVQAPFPSLLTPSAGSAHHHPHLSFLQTACRPLVHKELEFIHLPGLGFGCGS